MIAWLRNKLSRLRRKQPTLAELENDLTAAYLPLIPMDYKVRWLHWTGSDGETVIQLLRLDTMRGVAVKLPAGWTEGGVETAMNTFRSKVLKAHADLMSERPPELLKIPTPPTKDR